MTLLTLSPAPRLQFIDANGNPYSGAKLFTYASGTTTKISTYSDAGAVTANANPVILDAAGRALIYLLPQAYKLVLAPSNDSDPPVSPYFTTDPVGAVPTTTVDVDIDGTAGEDLLVGMPVFMSTGESGLTAGHWYRATAGAAQGSISALSIGFVPATIASGASGTIRTSGRITGLSGLTPGAIYYAALTPAGVLTATPPANARVWGVADSATSIIIAEKRNDSVTRVAAFITATQNTGSGEDTLASYVSGHQGLFSVGMGWEGRFWGTNANNADAKQLRLRLIEGANNRLIANFPLEPSIAGMWDLTFTIVPTTTTTFTSTAVVINGIDTGPISRGGNNVLQSTATLTNSTELRLTGEGVTTADIVMAGGMIKRIGLGF